MRTLLVVVAVAGCSSPSPEVEVDAMPQPEPDAPPLAPIERTVRSVLVGERAIVWVHGEGPACHHDFGCSMLGPSVTLHHRASGTTYSLLQDGIGARAIVGTDSEFFVVTGPQQDQMNVVRMAGEGGSGVNVAMSIPRTWTQGPALDDDYVYWAEPSASFLPYTLHRALRNGTGDDVTTIATTADQPTSLTYAAGYLWWAGAQGLTRVAVTGGSVEVLPIHPTALAGYDSELYVGTVHPNGNGTYSHQVGSVLADGSFQLIAEQPTQGDPVQYLVRADDRLFWSRRDGNVYSSPLTGGTIETIATGDTSPVFAVLPDQILVEFTRSGFRSVPR